MNTQIDLYNIAGDELNSIESGLNFWIEAVGIEDHDDNKFVTDAKERLTLRRKVIDNLIAETGGITNLNHINLKKLANPNNDQIKGILCSIVSTSCKNFLSDPSNSLASQEISKDEEFLDNYEYYDEEVCDYMTDYILKKDEF